MVEDMFVFLLYECVHLSYNFFRFFSFCHESSFCNGVMISCSIHGIDELYYCKEFFVIHHSWWNDPHMVFLVSCGAGWKCAKQLHMCGPRCGACDAAHQRLERLRGSKGKVAVDHVPQWLRELSHLLFW